jgi:hypothetical protein
MTVVGAVLAAALAFTLVRSGVVFLSMPDPGEALCVLETDEGAGRWSAQFRIEEPIEQLHVAVRPKGWGGAVLISLASSDYTCLDRFRQRGKACFTCGGEVPPGTFTLTVEQEAGHGGAVVAVAERPFGWTGWQILSLGLLCAAAISGALSWFTRRRPDTRLYAVSTHAFRALAIAIVCIAAYLLLHEGGHALAAAAFGRFDLSRSDFLGIHGTPHSGLNWEVPVRPWQRAIESFAGPALPTLVGMALFLAWRSRWGRHVRERSANVDLLATGVCTVLVLPFAVTVPAYMAGLVSDGDWRGFINNVPGPRALIYAVLACATAVCVGMLCRLVPHVRTLLRGRAKKS